MRSELFLPEADEEFREATRHYEREAPDLGIAFIAELHSAMASVEPRWDLCWWRRGHAVWGLRRHPTTLSTLLNWQAEALGVPPTRPGESSKTRTARHPANKRCRNARLVASGYVFRYPTFREGYTALLTSPPPK